jgi:hypothetical protein
MHRMLRNLSAAALASGTLIAQTVTIPAGTATAEGDSANNFPWGRGNGTLRHQCVYGSTNFTGQGLVDPLRITRLKWRLDAGLARSFSGATYNPATVRLSTSPLGALAASATFAQNRGTDLVTAFAGAAVMTTGSSAPPGPGPFVLDLPLQTPFDYWPRRGDLCVEVQFAAGAFSGATTFLDVRTAGSAATRVFNSTVTGATTGTVQVDHGVVIEVGYAPATGLFAWFDANVTSGPSPLVVQFTDRSWSSSAGGANGWAWDFDNDGVVDSTQRNPTHTFASCGTFDVALRVTDGVHPAALVTRLAHVVTDVVAPDFTSALAAPGGVVQFTDRSQPTPTAWAWDFDGDGLTDSTAQHPQFSFGQACGQPRDVTLRVHRLCRGPFSVTRSVRPAGSLETRRDGTTTFTSGASFDVLVTNPLGVSICQLEAKTDAAVGAALTCQLFVTPGSHVGATGNAALWRPLGTASATGVSGSTNLELATFAAPVWLPPGAHGVHLQLTGASLLGGTQTAPTQFPGADLVLTTGSAGGLGGPGTPNRVWNGALHYTTCGNNGDAGYTVLGLGCAGTLGVPGLTAQARPRLGRTATVLLERLPLAAAFFVMGFDATTSPLGPLPVDLAPFQAPGCALRIRPDAALFLGGSGSTATWNLAIPNDPSLLCLRFFHQALVLSPGSNGLGAVVSDAAAAIVGS